MRISHSTASCNTLLDSLILLKHHYNNILFCIIKVTYTFWQILIFTPKIFFHNKHIFNVFTIKYFFKIKPLFSSRSGICGLEDYTPSLQILPACLGEIQLTHQNNKQSIGGLLLCYYACRPMIYAAYLRFVDGSGKYFTDNYLLNQRCFVIALGRFI